MKFWTIAIIFLFIINANGQGLPQFKVTTPYYELYAETEDSLKTAQKEMDYCVEEFRKYFHKEFPPIAIIISDSIDRNNDDTLRTLPKKLGITSKTYMVLNTSTLGRFNIISHEAGHLLVSAYVKENWKQLLKSDSTIKNDNYEYPKIPDWVDEMVAILCEHPHLKEKRRVTMRDSIEKRIPVSEVLSKRMGHRLFYEEMLSVMEFIIEKEGNEIVNTIVEESIKKKTMEEILKQHAKNIPYKLDELEKVWVKWVKSK